MISTDYNYYSNMINIDDTDARNCHYDLTQNYYSGKPVKEVTTRRCKDDRSCLSGLCKTQSDTIESKVTVVENYYFDVI